MTVCPREMGIHPINRATEPPSLDHGEVAIGLAPHLANLGASPAGPSLRQAWIYRSPLRVVLIIGVMVFAAELILMGLLFNAPSLELAGEPSGGLPASPPADTPVQSVRVTERPRLCGTPPGAATVVSPGIGPRARTNLRSARDG